MALARLKRNRRKTLHRKRNRLCDNCHASVAKGELQRVRRRWLCPRCLNLAVDAGMEPEGAATAGSEPLPGGSDAADFAAAASSKLHAYEEELPARPRTLHERMDVWLRWGFLIGRCLFYAGFYWAAEASPVARLFFKGFILADVGAWGVRCVWELRHVKLAMLLEFFAYLAIVRLFYEIPGALTLPEAADDRALVALVFMGVFSVRVMWLVMQVRFGHGQRTGFGEDSDPEG